MGLDPAMVFLDPMVMGLNPPMTSLDLAATGTRDAAAAASLVGSGSPAGPFLFFYLFLEMGTVSASTNFD
jgi:hypothetical protein